MRMDATLSKFELRQRLGRGPYAPEAPADWSQESDQLGLRSLRHYGLRACVRDEVPSNAVGVVLGSVRVCGARYEWSLCWDQESGDATVDVEGLTFAAPGVLSLATAYHYLCRALLAWLSTTRPSEWAAQRARQATDH